MGLLEILEICVCVCVCVQVGVDAHFGCHVGFRGLVRFALVHGVHEVSG